MKRLIDQYSFQLEAGSIRLCLSPGFVEEIPGDWVGLELAGPGQEILEKESFGFLSTDRAAHDLRAPAAFRVQRVNERVLSNPKLAQTSPLGEGWLMIVEPFAGQPVA